MKKKLMIVAIATLSLTSICSGEKFDTDKTGTSFEQVNASAPASAIKKYQVKSGVVTFDTEMMNIKGKEVLYFDDFGAKELLEKYKSGKLVEATLGDGTSMYKIKYDQKAAYKMGDASRGVAYKFDYNEISKSDQATKVKKLANITIAGKECESYTYESGGNITTFAGWKNICLLKAQKTKYGTSTTKAIAVEENASISNEKFQIPAAFQIK